MRKTLKRSNALCAIGKHSCSVTNELSPTLVLLHLLSVRHVSAERNPLNRIHSNLREARRLLVPIQSYTTCLQAVLNGASKTATLIFSIDPRLTISQRTRRCYFRCALLSSPYPFVPFPTSSPLHHLALILIYTPCLPSAGVYNETLQ